MNSDVVPKLRARWGKELEHLNDDDLFEAYADFVVSEEFEHNGNDDSMFPKWVVEEWK